MLRLKCLLLESSKSNFAKEIHYGKWNPHEPFFVTSSRAPLSQFVMAMYNPSQSYSGAFLLSFICKSMYTIYCLTTKTQQRNLIVPQKFLSLFSLTQRAECIMKYMAVRKFIPFFFRLIALRTSYVTCVSYLFRHMSLKRMNQIHSDEGLTLETSVFESFTVANLPYRPCG